MRFRTTLWLLLLSLVGVGLIYWSELTEVTLDSQGREFRVLDVPPQEVVHFEIHAGEFQVAFKRLGRRWTLEDLPDIPLNSSKIDVLLARLHRARNLQVIPKSDIPEGGVADYGLELPSLRMVYAAEDGMQVEVQVGGRTPVGSEVYVRKVGRKDVWVVESDWLQAFPSDLAYFRNRRFLPGGEQPIVRLEIQGPSGLIQLQAEQGSWVMKQPASGLVDVEQFAGVLNLLSTMEIKEFVHDGAYNPAAYGLGEESGSVSVWFEGIELPVTLRQGRDVETGPGMVYAAIEGIPSVFAVTKGFETNLLRVDHNALLDPALIQESARSLGAFSLTQGKKQLRVVRQMEKGWQLDPTGLGPADPELLRTILQGWWAIDLDEPSIGEDPGLHYNTSSLPRWVVGLEFTGVSPIESERVLTHEILLYERTNVVDQLVVSYPERGVWGAVPLSVANGFSTDVMDFRWKEVLSVPPTDVVRLSQVGPQVTNVIRRANIDAPWVAEAEGHEPIADQVVGLLGLLNRLRVEAFVDHKTTDLSSYGLANPAWRISVGLSGRSGIGKTLLLGKETTDGGGHAMLLGQDPVFQLSKSDRELLLGPLVRVVELPSAAKDVTPEPKEGDDGPGAAE